MLFSLILPSYNHEKYVEHALNSCYEQNFDNIEIIIGDDYSTDGSVDIIRKITASKKFKSRFHRVVTQFSKINQGSYPNIANLNKFARGEYIGILNTDDYLPPNRLVKIVDSVRESGNDWGFTGVTPIDEFGIPIENSKLPISIADVFHFYNQNINRVKFLEALFFHRNLAVSSGNLFYKKKYGKIFSLLNNFVYCGDWAFVLCASYLSSPQYINEELLGYRIHSTNSFSGLKIEGELECDYLSILTEQLFINTIPKNPVFHKDDNYKWFKKFYKSQYCPLSPVDRQKTRGVSGANIVTNFNLVSRAVLTLNELQKI